MTRVLALVLLLVGCSTSGSSEPAAAPTTEQAAAATHEVTVLTRLAGPRAFYVEGAKVQLTLDRDEVMVGPVGRTARWDDVTGGPRRLVAATRACSGSREDLDPPTDRCTGDVEVTGPTRFLVTFRWGRPCRVTVLGASAEPVEVCPELAECAGGAPPGGPRWACRPVRRASYATDPVVHDRGVPLRRIVARYDVAGAAETVVEVRGLRGRATFRDAAGLIVQRDRWTRTRRTGWALQGGQRCAGT